MKTFYKKLIAIILTTFLILIALFALYVQSFKTPKTPENLTKIQQLKLEAALNEFFPERNAIISKLPYDFTSETLEISAENAILLDCTTGSIVFEKNADVVVPPASMTKLVVMYIALEEVAKGTISLSDTVELPPICWAKNLPPDSSIMFLDQGQMPTLEDLLLGMAIASGNDAAIAVACYISGDVESFVDRMNSEMLKLGLTKTHFVEPSGYSEKNLTTAKEFATFARTYLQKHPETLQKFHSQKKIVYPKYKNLPLWQKSKVDLEVAKALGANSLKDDGELSELREKHNRFAVTQYNTNKLLGLLDGCDGLKTGFIYESGYNLSLTASRNGVRFLSVTMHGKGVGSKEGNYYRIQDGMALMGWGFSNFANFFTDTNYSFTVAVPGGSKKFVNLVCAFDTSSLTVPSITGGDPKDAANKVVVTPYIPPYILEQTSAGHIYGKLVFSLDGIELKTVPLVADRDIKKAVLPINILGKAASAFLNN